MGPQPLLVSILSTLVPLRVSAQDACAKWLTGTGARPGTADCAYVKLQEHQPQDDRLYDATCPLGRKLTDANYRDLARNLRKAIGDET